MPRRVFFSFHFANDYWRVQQVINMQALERQKIVSSNEWQDVTTKGNRAIQQWIDEQMVGKSCVVVLVGSETAYRPWVSYEIQKGWNDGKGLLAISVNRLLDQDRQPSLLGSNPFAKFSLQDRQPLSSIAPFQQPGGRTSQEVYASIAANIEAWIEEAIAIRNGYD